MSKAFENFLKDITHATHCKEVEVIQSLWSGYGQISRYSCASSRFQSVVVKCIALQEQVNHPRGWNTNTSHLRKVKSYKVETHWYQEYSGRCNQSCKVPAFLGAFQEEENQWIVMEDLNVQYPLRPAEVGLEEVKVCLRWLANFHATFMHCKPIGLWDVGTYWHLDTRPDEFDKMNHPGLKSKARIIDKILNNCKFQSFVHGDAKLANFCFSTNRTSVAAVDFQYVGGGCGMKDVAYFLGSCLSGEDCALYEKELLDFYFEVLRDSIRYQKHDIDVNALEHEWRNMYAVACADFTRFMLGWMPSHVKVNAYNMRKVEEVLFDL